MEDPVEGFLLLGRWRILPVELDLFYLSDYVADIGHGEGSCNVMKLHLQDRHIYSKNGCGCAGKPGRLLIEPGGYTKKLLLKKKTFS
jgi:hypothetical protein